MSLKTRKNRLSDEPKFPTSILTVAARFQHENMPEEISLLLPTNPGPAKLISHLVDLKKDLSDNMIGIFLAAPTLNFERSAAQISQLGINWVCNFPSIAQQDATFSQQLSDVDLFHEREYTNLGYFKRAGVNIAAVVSSEATTIAALKVKPDALIVLPTVVEYAAGFPSPRQRSNLAETVREITDGSDWAGTIFGLADNGEEQHERLWPPFVDGIVCRPRRIKAL